MRPIRSMQGPLAVCAAALLAGCAAPSAPDPVRAGAALERACAVATADGLGAELATVHDFAPSARSRAADALGIGDALQVVALRGGSPAESAGLRIGDLIESVDGVPVGGGPKARVAFSHAAGTSHDERELRVLRDGEAKVIRVVPRSACRTRV